MGNLFAGWTKSSLQNAAQRKNHVAGDMVRGDSFQAVRNKMADNNYLSNDNTQFARDVIGWDKAQGMRQKAEAADVGAVSPDGKGGNRWDRRYNYTTDEMEWVAKKPSNFWKANKDELIQMGGALVGSIILPGYGTMLGAQLAKTGRDIKKARDARRDIRDDRREWAYEQAVAESEAEAERRRNMGNLFRSGGEGVIEYATNDLSKKKRDQYVRNTA